MGQRIFRNTDTNEWKHGFGRGTDGNLNITTPTTLDFAQTTINGGAGNYEVTINNVSGFTVGDFVMIFQSRTQNLTTGGNCEINVIKTISGNTVTMEYPLMNSYASQNVADTNGAAYAATMVKAPQYEEIDLSSTLTINPWDLATATRGNLIIFAKNIYHRASGQINVTAKGKLYGDGSTSQQALSGEGLKGKKNKSVMNDDDGGQFSNVWGKGGSFKSARTWGVVVGNNEITKLIIPAGGGGAMHSNGGGRGGRGAGMVIIYCENYYAESGAQIIGNGENGTYAARGGSGGAGMCLLIVASNMNNDGLVIQANGGAAGGGNNDDSSEVGSAGRTALIYRNLTGNPPSVDYAIQDDTIRPAEYLDGAELAAGKILL